MAYPTLEIHEGDWEDGVGDFPDGPALEEQARVHEAQSQKVESSAASHKYFITISRRAGHRRLHLTGCLVKPANCCEVRLCSVVTAEDFDSICRACKKRMHQETGKDTPEESSSTASSSSTILQMLRSPKGTNLTVERCAPGAKFCMQPLSVVFIAVDFKSNLVLTFI
eukprot:s171_g26.t1